MTLPFGYARTAINQIAINPQQAAVVRTIYDLYLQGKSLGGIADSLRVQNISSPTGNPNWTRAAIDKILSNGRYIPGIISRANSGKRKSKGSAEQIWKTTAERPRGTILRMY